MRIIAIIPARGGSKGIPRKNVKLLNGKPLIAYTIETAVKSRYITDVIVSTDDEEISEVSTIYGARVLKRPAELATDIVTLDPVINHAVLTLEQERKVDLVITIQPTSPLLSVKTLDSAIEYYVHNDFDTIISVCNEPHLAWSRGNEGVYPLYTERMNRQYLPAHYKETGAFVITRRECINETTRLGTKINVYEIPERESVDIDTKDDWILCQHQLQRKRIVIYTEGYKEIGLGHIYRSILLASNLFEHDVLIVTSEKSDMGIEKLKLSNLKYAIVRDVDNLLKLLEEIQPDILINDILNTTEEYVLNVKKIVPRVINFEDLGSGGRYADAVINALYEEEERIGKYYWGEKYYCLRDEFIINKPKQFSDKVKSVLIAFGGTDPSGFTERILEVIKEIPDTEIEYQFILGVGYNRVEEFVNEIEKVKDKKIFYRQDVQMPSKYMAKADLAISSQGRTMYELASQHVPTIILAHSDREATHEFGFLKNGFINLGNGNRIDNSTITETVLWLLHSPQIRKQMHDNMASISLTDGIERVLKIILES